MSKYQVEYFNQVIKLVKKIQKNQKNKISQTAKIIKKTYKAGGLLYLFGTGHSHMLTIEAFFRAGGFAGACPIIDKRIDFSHGARKATNLERTPGVAKKILSKYKFNKKDTFMIFSNSGVNQVPVEAALFAKSKNMNVVSVISRDYSNVAPLSSLQKRLYEISDIFIDNHIPAGDALVKINKTLKVAAGSTITGAFIINSILVELAGMLSKENSVPYYISSNMPNSKKNNLDLVNKYSKKIPHL
jgi:uncharacterized phosphosugar-binding protein|tara:strand:- start:731 stop:1462 length:732 start_codon:yes stop_codon:yes gene_type:complete